MWAALRQRVEIFAVGESRVDLCAAMTTLHQMGIRRLLVEGGGTLNFELLRLGLVDEVHVYIAPMIFGGNSAPTLADGSGLPREAAVTLVRTEVDVDDDGGVVLRYKVNPA
jgi:2,5-diamino-6-(ribosylamino)-4(3H)-pyrimidinone 5'-phosphate reductase